MIQVKYSGILFWMTIFAIINVAVSDGTSPSKNHATGPIVAVAVASACLATAANARQRRSFRKCNHVESYNNDSVNDNDDDESSQPFWSASLAKDWMTENAKQINQQVVLSPDKLFFIPMVKHYLSCVRQMMASRYFICALAAYA